MIHPIAGRLLTLSTGGAVGERVLILHAGLAAARAWGSIGAALGAATGATVVAYDRLGYAPDDPVPVMAPDFLEQEVPPLLALLEGFGDGSAHLVGHSDGGTIALLAAAQRPDAVRSLTLIGIHTFTERINLEAIGALRAASDATGIPDWLERLHGARGAELLRAWSDAWLHEERTSWDVRDRLPAELARIPMLIVQGTEDEYGTLEQVHTLTARYPHAATWIVPDAGHAPHTQEREAFIARVAAFIGRSSVSDLVRQETDG